MSDVFKYFGALSVIVCAFLISRSYSLYLKRGVRECECFLSLLQRIEGAIRCFLSPVGEIFSGFECSEGSVMEFVNDVRSGKTVKDAFSEREATLAVGKEGKKILSELFSELGRGYKDGTVALISAARSEMEKYTLSAGEEEKKNSKLVAALLLGGAVGALLLFL